VGGKPEQIKRLISEESFDAASGESDELKNDEQSSSEGLPTGVSGVKLQECGENYDLPKLKSHVTNRLSVQSSSNLIPLNRSSVSESQTSSPAATGVDGRRLTVYNQLRVLSVPTLKTKRRNERKQEGKAAKTLSAILAVFIVTWTPYNVLTLVKTFSSLEINTTLYSICE